MSLPKGLTPEHQANTDSAKPRRRRIINATQDALTGAGVMDSVRDRGRHSLSNLPGNGLLMVSVDKKRMWQRLRDVESEGARSPGGWVGLLTSTSNGPTVMLPLSEFVKIAQRMEEEA